MKEQAITQPAREEKLGEYLQRKDVIEKLRQAIGNKANIEEFISNITMDVAKSDELKQCTFHSILQAAIDAANFGLVPNKTLGHAYLIPFNNRFKLKDDNGNAIKDAYDKEQWGSRWEATLMIGYKGYVKKFGELDMTVEVELVTKQEIETGRFREIRGSESRIHHEPLRIGIRDKENIALGYAIGRKAGRQDVIVVMSFDEIMESGKTQVWENKQKVSKHKGVWVTDGAARSTDFAEMCKKTLIRRLAKVTDVDVVNRMSSFEGEKEGQMQDVTPVQAAQPVTFLQSFKAQHSVPFVMETAIPQPKPVMAATPSYQGEPMQLDLETVIQQKTEPNPLQVVTIRTPQGTTEHYPTTIYAAGILSMYDKMLPGDMADFRSINNESFKDIAEIERKKGNAETADKLLKLAV